MNEQAAIDFVCDVAYFNGKVLSRSDNAKAIQDALACGLLREDGNGRYKLTDYGRDYVMQRRDDEKRAERGE